ncbi:UNVERIFIED_CONTAM: hypothetical protein GTU68_017705, partial [Idotea baltica]|nr:hypothetical protein [Idotea baltica]
FEKWFSNPNVQAKIKIQVRLDRAESGNFGDYKSVKNGVYELRIHVLSGLRIYFGLDGKEIILLFTWRN